MVVELCHLLQWLLVEEINANNIIRVHSATLNYSGTLTLASSENGLVAGPLTVAGSTVLDVQGTLVVL
jgi:hypothetical protein